MVKTKAPTMSYAPRDPTSWEKLPKSLTQGLSFRVSMVVNSDAKAKDWIQGNPPSTTMHNAPRTIYNHDVDFKALALSDADFKAHLKPNGQLDFSDPAAVKQLTTSLLKRDFGIQIQLPDDRLCPPVKQESFSSSSLYLSSFSIFLIPQPTPSIPLASSLLYRPTIPLSSGNIATKAEVDGRAQSVFSRLTALRQSAEQEPVASIPCSAAHNARDGGSSLQVSQLPLINPHPLHLNHVPSTDTATRHRRQESLLRSPEHPRQQPNPPHTPSPHQTLRPTHPPRRSGHKQVPPPQTSSPIIFVQPPKIIRTITFTLSNPPFYPSLPSLLASATSKSRPPYSTCTGSPIEMVTPGGETAFVTRMIDESSLLKERCQWYTSMLGKYSSVGAVVEELKRKGVGNWAVREFVQGGKTRRWGVGWSWGGRRPREDIARGVSTSIPRSLLPFPSELCFHTPATSSISNVGQRLDSLLQSLDLQWQYRAPISTGVGFAKANVWSRAARRERERRVSGAEGIAQEESSDEGEEEEEEAALGFKVQLSMAKEREGVDVMVRWLQGRESVLFESFCGMFKREIVN
ncbi:MAG: hypothetical protein L6R40_002571 [Gallowayella cf. fulva]|nr:MAG: hypothetical protein L6R40_002571 [Xanthomendoza cf. fulva]